MKHDPASHCAAARCHRNRSSVAALAALFLVAAGNILPLSAKSNPEPTADNLPGLGLQPVEYFYTGKPYDADTETYTFKYRNYDPELNRWTTADPSGFPDGANNQIYAPTPTNGMDPLGLWSQLDYVYHYFFGKSPYIKGGTVNMGAVGNGSEIRSYTYSHESSYRSEIEDHIYNASYYKKDQFSGYGSTTVNIDYEPVLFMLGNSNVRIDYDFTGSGSIDPLDNITYNYSYTAHLQFYINDAFVDALDIKDWFPGNQDVGSPFGLVYNWESVMGGEGSYE